MHRGYLVILLLISALGLTAFTLDNALVPKEEILSGGPPKDGIPAILAPNFIGAAQADFMKPSDPVIGVTIGDKAKAYPIKILNWHEIVNDEIDGLSLVVTF